MKELPESFLREALAMKKKISSDTQGVQGTLKNVHTPLL